MCWLCGDALSIDEEGAAGFVQPQSLRCAACGTQEPPYERAVSFGSYRGTLRQLVHLYKFEGVRSLATPLGERLARSMDVLVTAAVLSGRYDVFTVVAVPLFPGKRSFNQSELLANESVRRLRLRQPSLPVACGHTLLRRIRPTESQSHLTPLQRRTNVRNAFACEAAVQGRHILLVDDVLTTGATASECTAELLRSGAASVHVLTLARAHRRDTVPSHPALLGGAGWTAWDAPPTGPGLKYEPLTEEEVKR